MKTPGMRRTLPAHLRARPDLVRRLRREANGLRGLYGAPVYLCGSALLDANERPRDWDVRITLSDADFSLRYGDAATWEAEGQSGAWSEVRWRWSDDCVKRSKILSRVLCLNVDFQVYPASHVRHVYRHQPRLRLDTRRAAPAEGRGEGRGDA